jgi:pullulanase
MKTADTDCYNWGYDPYHYNAPEGSYASDPEDGARRIIELREMVMNLHRAGLRVGMDVVYNHTFMPPARREIGPRPHRARLLPPPRCGGRRRAQSTCCDNTATENIMMGKLMIDSAVCGRSTTASIPSAST